MAMDFGRVPYNELDNIDFTLPASMQPLGRQPDADPSEFKFFFGTARFGAPDWKGSIYPKKTKDAEFLQAYVNIFNYIEFNAPFFAIPEREQIRNWAKKVEGRDFIFNPKISQAISHRKRFRNCEDETQRYFEAIAEMKEHLGTVIIQLGENFTLNGRDVLLNYLQTIPQGFRVAVEFRSNCWYEDRAQLQETFGEFGRLGVGTIISDTPGRRDVLHMHLSTDEAIVRFNGNASHPSEKQRLLNWKEQILTWKAAGIKRVYFGMHQTTTEDLIKSIAIAKEVFGDL